MNPLSIVVDLDGDLIVADNNGPPGQESVRRIDPSTGANSLLATGFTNPIAVGIVTTACSDGLDNDGDGLVDLADPGCRDAEWALEDPQCQDGANNDTDEGIDFDGGASIFGQPIAPADPQCTSFWDDREAPNPTSACGLGAELPAVLLLLAWLRRQSRRMGARR